MQKKSENSSLTYNIWILVSYLWMNSTQWWNMLHLLHVRLNDVQGIYQKVRCDLLVVDKNWNIQKFIFQHWCCTYQNKKTDYRSQRESLAKIIPKREVEKTWNYCSMQPKWRKIKFKEWWDFNKIQEVVPEQVKMVKEIYTSGI